MPECKHYYVCGRDAEGNLAEGLCILHSTDPAKDAHTFAEALAAHRERKGDNFRSFVFPRPTLFGEGAEFIGATFSGAADFFRATFSEEANFREATFTEEADFVGATFAKKADFSGVTFAKKADFFGVTFAKKANFSWAKFPGGAEFLTATFTEEANFLYARFSEEANFSGARFSEEANFSGARFTKAVRFLGATFVGRADFVGATFTEEATFFLASFLGRALFAGIPPGVRLVFSQVAIQPPGAVTFLEADLTRCQFLDTDLRQAQMVAVTWPQIGRLKATRRIAVYDEIRLRNTKSDRSSPPGDLPWVRVERLYRELKQNYEDRRDYERAGDFHYGEKQMRRWNPDTSWGLWLFLTLYWLFSGYGERYLRPLVWAGLLFAGSTFGYMWWGLHPKPSESSLAWTNGWGQLSGSSLAWTNGWDWLQAAYYSFQVMTFLKPDDWIPVGYAHVINTFQTLLSPLFLGLFALALRQRLKR